MKERLLQYIWQFQYFNKSDLFTSHGDEVQVIHPGNYNHNQGPDFSEARIRVNETTWAGNVELHVNSSDWDLHDHSSDNAYGNIILHVVWKNDREITDISGKLLPTIELHNRVPKILLNKYEELMLGASTQRDRAVYRRGYSCSFAFNEDAPILDTNVIRVLHRVFVAEGDPKAQKTMLWELSESLIPPGKGYDFNQAMMDFGAMVCTARDPYCLLCPMKSFCKTYPFSPATRERL